MVDATWALARRLARHLDRLGAGLPHVMLETELVSIYARTQTQSGRVCTVEAVALFLREMGESQALFDALVAAVATNNRALRHETVARRPPRWKAGPTMGHPAWYYGVRSAATFD